MESAQLRRYSEDMRLPPRRDGRVLLSWNVAGLRAYVAANPDGLRQLVQRERANVLCLQETKLQKRHVPDVEAKLGLDGWHCFWSCSVDKPGYSGTMIACRTRPLSVQYGMGNPLHDRTGRLVTVEFPDCYVCSTYAPNAGAGLKNLGYRVLEWDVCFFRFIRNLEQRKPVIIAGDLNVARDDIDVYDPRRHVRSAGFTVEERHSFENKLMAHGMVDAFRELHPEVIGYTFYSRQGNMKASLRGWRLDYFLLSAYLKDSLYDCFTLTEEEGSDHVPIGIVVA